MTDTNFWGFNLRARREYGNANTRRWHGDAYTWSWYGHTYTADQLH